MNFFVQRYEIILIYANILRIIMQRNAIFRKSKGSGAYFSPTSHCFHSKTSKRVKPLSGVRRSRPLASWVWVMCSKVCISVLFLFVILGYRFSRAVTRASRAAYSFWRVSICSAASREYWMRICPVHWWSVSMTPFASASGAS